MLKTMTTIIIIRNNIQVLHPKSERVPTKSSNILFVFLRPSMPASKYPSNPDLVLSIMT